MARKVVLDVDTGIDDALALLLALRSPELEVLGVTCVAGNVTIDHVTRNTLAVLELASAHIPVAVGARKPLLAILRTATTVHGINGLADVEMPVPRITPIEESAPSFLCRMAREHRSELTVIAVGPLTNIALAVLLDRDFATNLGDLVIMGGAVSFPGNATPAAEANFSNDPEAAAAVAASGARFRLVDLGATTPALLPEERLNRVRSHGLSPVADLSLKLLRFYSAYHFRTGVPGSILHDPLAVGLTANPEMATYVPMHLTVETGGELSRGASIGNFNGWVGNLVQDDDHLDFAGVDPVPMNATLARKVDVPRFLDEFMTRLELE